MKSKLGWGSFSTVWRCEDRDEGIDVAVKVVQSEKTATAMAKDEVTLLLKVQERGEKERHLGSQLIVRLLRNFEQWGPNGKHQCLVLEALGSSLLSCIQQNKRGLSMNKVKEVMSQVMQGLDFLHSSAGIIHTDVKPENILLVKAGRHDFSADGPPMKVKIGDLGGACWTDERFSVEIGTRQYRAPEVLLGVRDYGPGKGVYRREPCDKYNIYVDVCFTQVWMCGPQVALHLSSQLAESSSNLRCLWKWGWNFL